jgi:hypothetical protein
MFFGHGVDNLTDSRIEFANAVEPVLATRNLVAGAIAVVAIGAWR